MGIVSLRNIPFGLIFIASSLLMVLASWAFARAEFSTEEVVDSYGYVEPLVVAGRGKDFITKNICFYYFEKENYKEVANSCDNSKVKLVKGNYVLRTVYDQIINEQSINVEPASLNKPLVNMGIGFINIENNHAGMALQDDSDVWHYVFDASGKKRIIGVTPKHNNFALKAGKYMIVTKQGDKEVKTDIKLKPGEKLNLLVTLP